MRWASGRASRCSRRLPMRSGRSPTTSRCRQRCCPRGGEGADMRLSRLAVFLSPLLLGGCAPVLTGTRQDIQVDSQPAGAVCPFTRAGERLGSVTTPGSLNVQRNAAPVTVVCTRDDYEEARAVLNARNEVTTTGSAVIGGLIVGGFIATHIDRGSGAANRYDTSLRVELAPMSAADKAAAAARLAGPPGAARARLASAPQPPA